MTRKLRYEELKELWERESRSRPTARVTLVAVPADMVDMKSLYRGFERPEGLRGRDLVQGLAQLALEWGDRRFAQCVRALFELGIVEKQTHTFTRKRGSHLHLVDKPEDAEVATRVQTLMDRGDSERLASAKVAVDLRLNAASFEAAIEQVRNASRRARKSAGKRARG